jgi:ribosomal protein L11
MPKKFKDFHLKMQLSESKQNNLMPELGKRLGPEGLPNKQIAADLIKLSKEKGITDDEKRTVLIQVHPGKKYTATCNKYPDTSTLILQEIGITKGAKTPGQGEPIAVMSYTQLKNVALKKMQDEGMNIDASSAGFATNLSRMTKKIQGTARSMGISCEKVE